MSIPVDATVQAVPNFLSGLQAAHAFMVRQDASSAQARFGKLRSELVKARDLLAFSPSSGRPARFMEASTGWGRFQAQQALQLARELGTPALREIVLERHIVLYAHSEQAVILLALRHERQLAYGLSEMP